MKHKFISSLLIVITIFIFSPLYSQTANHVVISEFATRGQSSALDEFVELYNPTETEISLQNWKYQYKAATSSTWNDRAVLPSNAIIPPHGFYLLANDGGYTGSITADYSSSLWNSGSGMADNGNIRIIDNNSVVIDKIGYGNGNDPEGSDAVNHGTSANNLSVERKARSSSTADSLGVGGLHVSLGNGYDSDNNLNDFVKQTHGRNPQNSRSASEPSFGVGGNGTGIITVTAPKVFVNETTSLSFTITGESGFTLEHIQIVIPTGWSQSGNFEVALSGNGLTNAVQEMLGDTIDLTSCEVTNTNTGTISVNNIIAPSSATTSTFRFLTAVDSGTIAPVLAQPSIKVTVISSIVSLHINNNQGVPVSPYGVGTEVTITGIVTANISASQTNVFIQDSTGGVCLFNASRPMELNPGDSLLVTGTIVQFRGLIEISPNFALLEVLSTGRPLPEPLVISCYDAAHSFQGNFSEPNEGRLVRINNVAYHASTNPPSIEDSTGSVQVFIPDTYPPTPTLFDVIGILKQFKPGSPAPGPPYISDYEIAPRFPEDIIPVGGPVVTITPSEDSMTSTSMRISWSTDVLSSSVVYYGTSEAYTDSVVNLTATTSHSITITGLTPSTFYHYAVASEDISGKTIVSDFLACSGSPAGATGQINVYFNKNVDTTVSIGEKALGDQDLTSIFVSRINAAHYSIDAAFYNLSGAPGAALATALVNAKNRGVAVRVIGEFDNLNNSPYGTLSTNGIPVISDIFDATNGGGGLMHNKFAVIDLKGTAADSVWVWTGSWNPTDQGTNNDRQNSIEFQDVSMAKAYTAEFEEMWGSSSQTPNSSNTRFGSRKTNNTPHRFNLNGTPVQIYFSAGERTSANIIKTFSLSQYSVCAAIYTFTRQDFADTLIALKNRGKKIRVVTDNGTDTGTQYPNLVSGGVDVHLKGFSGGLLHHKYAIIDGTRVGGTQYVITGSHNWSNSAENTNDENTVIVQSNRIANLFLQEFNARYEEAGGTDNIVLDVKETGGIPKGYALAQNYPNPFNPTTELKFSIRDLGFVSLKIYDILGREVQTLVNEKMQPGNYKVEWNAGGIPSGVYFYRIATENFTDTKRMVLMK